MSRKNAIRKTSELGVDEPRGPERDRLPRRQDDLAFGVAILLVGGVDHDHAGEGVGVDAGLLAHEGFAGGGDLVVFAALQVDADGPVVRPVVPLLAHPRQVDAVPRRVDDDLLLAALAVGGDPVDDEVAPLGGDGFRLSVSVRSRSRPGSARSPLGCWADTIAPAATTPSTRAAADTFSLVSIMVLHVLSYKEITDREITPRLAAPPVERAIAARAVACTNSCRTTTAGIAGRATATMAGTSTPRRARLLRSRSRARARRPRTVSSVTPRLAAAAWYDIASR